jgi:hypothetical protein
MSVALDEYFGSKESGYKLEMKAFRLRRALSGIGAN